MSKEIDSKVVEMAFDNSNFEKNVSESMSTLDKLNSKLKLSGATEGLENVASAAEKIDLSGLSNSASTIGLKFSALTGIATGAFMTIGNQAVVAGEKIVKSFALDPIIDGFHEYETQLNSVQTILANTASKGSTLDDVNNALDELNTYADQTIYNFTEMTRNIGTFTAAGVDLDQSVSAIKGISNLAAVSGSNATQASTAMYQLSQAIATGTVRLEDWNSVVNAGMGGELFQNALERTARHMGKDVDGLLKKYGSFRESLTKGEWLTTDVLTETLKQISGAYSEADLIAQGYSEDEAKAIADLGKTATDAATKVKTFSQLIDTTKEAIGSGWTQTWQILFGDFDEAKELWTGISNVINDMVNKSASARNDLLQQWSDMGGRSAIIDGLQASFEGLSQVLGTVKQAFSEVFPPITADKLANVSNGFKTLMEKLKPSEDMLNKIHSSAKGVFSSFDLIGKALSLLNGPAKLASGIIKVLGEDFISISANVGDAITAFDSAKSTSDWFSRASEAIENACQKILDAITNLDKYIPEAFSNISNKLREFINNFSNGSEKIDTFGNKVGTFFSNIAKSISKFNITDLLPKGSFDNAIGNTKNVFSDLIAWLKNNLKLEDVFAGVGLGAFLKQVIDVNKVIASIGDAVKNFKSGGLIEMLFGSGDGDSQEASKNAKDSGSFLDSFKDILDGVKDSLKSLTTSIKVSSLVAIAGSIGIIASSLDKFASVDSSALTSVAIAIGELMGALAIMNRIITATGGKGLTKSAFSLVIIAEAIKIYAKAMAIVGAMDFGSITKSLGGLGSGLAEMAGILVILNKFAGSGGQQIASAAAILILSLSLKKIGNALSQVAKLSWDEIARGLVGIGGALGELSGMMILLTNLAGSGWQQIASAAAILILSLSLKKIGNALSQVAKLSWDEIARGLVGIGGALGEISGVIIVLNGFAGSGIQQILSAGAIYSLSLSLKNIGNALSQVAKLSWDEIARGLAGMGGAFTEMIAAIAILGKVGSFESVFAAATMDILANDLPKISEALSNIGSLSWSEIARGLTGMGGAFTELIAAITILGKVGSFESLVGAAAIDFVTISLPTIADALVKIGSMTWDQIGVSLAGLGGAIAELGLGSFATGLGGLASLFGSISIDVISQSLGNIADALVKLGKLDWQQMDVAVTGLGNFFSALAVGAFANTLSGAGVQNIAAAAEPLGNLAEALKKWSSVPSTEGIDKTLQELGTGIAAFTFDDAGAEALNKAAGPVGTLADSVKKWDGVTVPQGIASQLQSLSTGVSAFTFGGWAADAIATVAAPLGTLAESVKKWDGVTVPQGIGLQLQDLASGISAFTLDSFAASALSDVSGPLGVLADSVKSWSDVQIPEDFPTNLTNVAAAIGSFEMTGFAADDIRDLAGPVGDLADSVREWNGTGLTNVNDRLHELSQGLTELLNVDPGSISNVASSISDLKNALANFNSDMLSSISTGLSNYASAMDTMPTDTSAFTAVGQKIVDTIAQTISNGGITISAALQSMMSGAPAILESSGQQLMASLASGIANGEGTAAAQLTASLANITVNIDLYGVHFETTGQTWANNLAKGFGEGGGSISSNAANLAAVGSISAAGQSGMFTNAGTSWANALSQAFADSGRSIIIPAASDIAGQTISTLSSFTSTMQNVGSAWGLAVANGILSMASNARTAGQSLGSAAGSGISSSSRSGYSSAESAGEYIAQGLIDGMNARLSSVRSKAAELSSAATDAIASAAQIGSPSKITIKYGKWIAEGLGIGMDKKADYAAKSGRNLANSALQALSDSMSDPTYLSEFENLDPTITPVVDLSNVASSARMATAMLTGLIPAGTVETASSIGNSVNTQNQNGSISSQILDALRASLALRDTSNGPTVVIDGNTINDTDAIQQATEDYILRLVELGALNNAGRR